MADALPRIYLISPPSIDLEVFPDQLAHLLDTHEVACFRLALAGDDAEAITRAADRLREVAHPRDVPLVISRHLSLAARLGLDGVHLEGTRGLREARKLLGDDGIVGAHCGSSRHDGMTAAEIGADYVSFGPLGSSDLGLGQQAPLDLFAWWSEMIEVPVVAEGALNVEIVASLAASTDFLGIGAEIWSSEDPSAALGRLLAPLVS